MGGDLAQSVDALFSFQAKIGQVYFEREIGHRSFESLQNVELVALHIDLDIKGPAIC